MPLFFRVPLLKPNSRKKGTLIKGLLRNLGSLGFRAQGLGFKVWGSGIVEVFQSVRGGRSYRHQHHSLLCHYHERAQGVPLLFEGPVGNLGYRVYWMLTRHPSDVDSRVVPYRTLGLVPPGHMGVSEN